MRLIRVQAGSSWVQIGTKKDAAGYIYLPRTTPEPGKWWRWPLSCVRAMCLYKGCPAMSWFYLGIPSCVVSPSMCDVTENTRRWLHMGETLPPRRSSRPQVARLNPNTAANNMLNKEARTYLREHAIFPFAAHAPETADNEWPTRTGG